MVTLSIQGSEGCFSEIAARKAYHPQRPKFVYCSTYAEAVELVHQTKADHAFLPVENNSTGIIEGGHLAAVSSELKKGKSQWIPIDVALAAMPGTRVDDITQVFGHPDVLEACNDYLHLRGWIANVWRDSSEAAAEVRHQGADVYGALCSPQAAALHGLEIIREHVQDRDDHKTRFQTLTPYARSKAAERGAVAAPI